MPFKENHIITGLSIIIYVQREMI